jgi:hypothetical protein
LTVISYEEAYPGIQFLPRSRNWWAWLKGTPAECAHLDSEINWIASLLPDAVYFRGKRAVRRESARPEVSLCRACLIQTIADELKDYPGRVVAFEPDPAFTQYFFVAVPDFGPSGLAPAVSAAIEKRLAHDHRTCTTCDRHAAWLWFSREEIASLDEADKIGTAAGEPLCAAHGGRKLCEAFERIEEANVFYMNLPYGEAGAYVWI